MSNSHYHGGFGDHRVAGTVYNNGIEHVGAESNRHLPRAATPLATSDLAGNDGLPLFSNVDMLHNNHLLATVTNLWSLCIACWQDSIVRSTCITEPGALVR